MSDTGFDSKGLMPKLNELGKKCLPVTPAEDNNITKNPFVTDVTELLAIKLIRNQNNGVVFPYPRVFHKELKGNQHKGIDDVWAVPVLVRPTNMWNSDDWKPFLSVTKQFEGAKIPSTVHYYAIECDCKFSELIDCIKKTTSG